MGENVHSPMTDGLIDFLQAEGIGFDFIDNHYLHQNAKALDGYRLVILSGHNEYWTHDMRQTVETHVDAVKNDLNISGNVMWFKTMLRVDRIHVNKGSEKEGRDKLETWTGKYYHVAPIESLLGISYQFAGYQLSRKSETYGDTLALEARGDRFDPAEYDARKDSMRIFLFDHPVFDGEPRWVEWIGEEKYLLKIEIDGAPLVSIDPTEKSQVERMKEVIYQLLDIEIGLFPRYRVEETFLKRIDGMLTVLAIGWAI